MSTYDYHEVHLNKPEVYFGFITDVHLSDKPPGRRVDNYRGAIIGKLQFVKEWLKSQAHKHNADPVCLCGGDLFHVKNPESLSNKNHLVTEVMNTLKDFPGGRIYGVVGNHDVQFDNHNTLNNQPLGLLIAGDAYFNLKGPTIFTTPITSVEVWPFDASNELETLEQIQTASKEPRKGVWRIGIAHAMARPGGAQTMFGHPIIGYDLLEDVDFDVILWGHDHSFVPTQQVGECYHIHPGSLARAALSYDEVNRDPMVIGLRFGEELNITHKKLHVNPLEIAFRVADKEVVDAAKSETIVQYTLSTKSMGAIEVIDAQGVLEELINGDKPLQELINDVCEF